LNCGGNTGCGLKQAGKGDFETLEKKVLEWGEPTVPSGKQVNGVINLGSLSFTAQCKYISALTDDCSLRPFFARFPMQELAEMLFQSAL
jgi:hypothetical protein